MKTILNSVAVLYAFCLLTSCESIYFLNTTNIEVLIPAKIVFPTGYNNMAVRYNNSNEAYNPHFAEYEVDMKILTDNENLDSMSAEIYFQSFSEKIKNSLLFDSVNILQKGSYANVWFSDSLVNQKYDLNNKSNDSGIPVGFAHFVNLSSKFQPEKKSGARIRYIDPDYGLYTKKEVTAISDSSGADMLLSLDYYAVLDAEFDLRKQTISRDVLIVTTWSFYDLKTPVLPYYHYYVDTISWRINADQGKIPPRKEALLMAADISGAQFADLLVPHWIDVERAYYSPWRKELKGTRTLMAEGEWVKAAGYWKPLTNDKNKRTAAWSMFNMALAAEMGNQIDAAIDWVVRSYHLYAKKDDVHKQICEDYLKILAQRKLDINKINLQFEREN